MTLSGYIPDLIEEDFNGLGNECAEQQPIYIKKILLIGAFTRVEKKYWKQCIKALDLPMAN